MTSWAPRQLDATIYQVFDSCIVCILSCQTHHRAVLTHIETSETAAGSHPLRAPKGQRHPRVPSEPREVQIPVAARVSGRQSVRVEVREVFRGLRVPEQGGEVQQPSSLRPRSAGSWQVATEPL